VKQTVAAVFVFILISLGFSSWWFWQDMQTRLNAPLKLETPLDYTIKPGMTLPAVAEDIRQLGLMNQSHYLILHARIHEIAEKIKAGEYHILPGTTPIQLLDQFIKGEVIHHSLTIVEGWTFKQMMEAIKNSQYLTHTLDATDSKSVMAELDCPNLHHEGRFFPDTYHFPAGTTDLEYLNRAFDRLHDVLNEEWLQRAENLPYQSMEEALVMASIIEKETGVAEERAQIAGVFVRRLQHNMLLQTDPTVIYAMGETFDGNIRKKDLDIDSPYNTYRYEGLPPTPIAIPGREAIHAALHPDDGNTLYFVAKGDGSHHFSATLNEHNKAVAKYQLSKQ